MIWSSFSDGKYAVLEAETDHIRGAWKHKKGRFEFEGGHAMLFDDLNGNVKISLHQPNNPPEERACFAVIIICETENSEEIKAVISPLSVRYFLIFSIS